MNFFQILEDGKGRSGLADQSKFTQFSVSVDVLKIFLLTLRFSFVPAKRLVLSVSQAAYAMYVCMMMSLAHQ